MRLTTRAFLFLLILSPLASAASPRLTVIVPPGGQRGTERDITVTGSQLADVQEILFYQPGIEVVGLEPLNDKSFKAKLRIAADSPLGLHDLRVRTATGVSRLMTFSVGTLPEIEETEPNNEFETPQAIPLDVVVNGVAEREDVDYFVVEAKKGERITAEIEGIRLGLTLFDPYVAILDEKRFELATSDDAALVFVDGVCSILAPEDGTYLIQVRESAYAGNGQCRYRLHVGRFPRPRALLPAGGPAGETVEVTWIGDVAGDRTTAETLPAEPNENHGLVAEDELGTAPYPNEFRVSPFGNVLEVEPNNDHNTATPFTPPIALNGVLGEEGDVDHFTFKATKGQVIDVRVFARSLRSPLDAVISVAKKGGGNVAANDDTNGPDSYIRFTAPADGEYVVVLRDHLKQGGPTYFYRVELTPVAPKLTMGVPNEVQRRYQGRTYISVPKGNRQAILVTASRADFGGDLTIGAEGLPKGVAIECDTMPANQSQFPVLFTAKEDAPVSGTLAALTGTPTDTNLQIPSIFRHTVELTLGANNVPFWTRTVDKLAVTVAEAAPYTIEIVEPKVPLVRNGTMNLKVVAHREEGFNSKVRLRLPWLPPGVGASGSVEIPEGKNEALIPMNANGNAEVRTWKIVVDGVAESKDGFLSVSSQLANLSIAEPFVGLAFQNMTVEQGESVNFLVKLTKLHDFPDKAEIELVGLPNQATTDKKMVDQDASELVFPIATTDQTPDGKHGNLFCRVTITMNGEPIVHNIGKGELRVDKPLPPKADAVAVAPKPDAKPKPAKPAEKPLSPLEKLRLEAAERAKAQAAGTTPEPAASQ